MQQQPYYQGGQEQNTVQYQQQTASNAAPPPSPNIRWSWACLPHSKKEVEELVVPLGCVFLPLMDSGPETPNWHIPVASAEPIQCTKCHAVFNPYSRLDASSRMWVCGFCLGRNMIDPSIPLYGDHVPPQLLPTSTTIEFPLPPPAGSPSGSPNGLKNGLFLIFLVDLQQPVDELDALKEILIRNISLLPSNTSVGLITFGANVNVWELAFPELHKAVFLPGTIDDEAAISELLLGSRGTAGAYSFVPPLEDVEATLTGILEELSADPWPVAPRQRAPRCTGVALRAAAALASGLRCRRGRIISFLAGCCTIGPGAIVERELEHAIRTHSDVRGDLAKLYAPAVKTYDDISKALALGKPFLSDTSVVAAHQAPPSSIAVDFFIGSLDQVGLLEMRRLCDGSGGVIVLADSFKNEGQCGRMVSDSFQRFVAGLGADESSRMCMSYDVTIEVQCSADLRLAGMAGPVTETGKMSSSVATRPGSDKNFLLSIVGGNSVSNIFLGPAYSDTPSCSAHASSVSQNTAIACFFQAGVSEEDATGTTTPPPPRLVQFLTTFTRFDGSRRLRVTTVAHPVTTTADKALYTTVGTNVFDQETSIVLVARLATRLFDKREGNISDVLRWLDRLLVRVVRKFATFNPGDAASVRLSSDHSLFPQFLFHLRRSELLQVFNSSPDESVYFRSTFERSTVHDGVVMIQPTLFVWDFTDPNGRPALLDSTSVQPDNILLLDTFWIIVVHAGSTVTKWRKANYQDDPNYAHFKTMLTSPLEEAAKLIASRFPRPRLVECDQHASQARYLYNRINPSLTHKNDQYGSNPGEIVYTDDANLQTFLQHLRTVVVNSDVV